MSINQMVYMIQNHGHEAMSDNYGTIHARRKGGSWEKIEPSAWNVFDWLMKVNGAKND